MTLRADPGSIRSAVSVCTAEIRLRKIVVSIFSLATSVVLSFGKLALGLITGSLALVADGLQGLVDIIVTMVTLMVVVFSDRPPDPAWTCGRDKLEALAALIEAALLTIIAICIWYLAAQKLLWGKHDVSVEPWFIGAVAVAIVADYWRARLIRWVARDTGSLALEANAAHFMADSAASLAVLLGLLAAHQGWPVADTLATFVVAGFLSWTAWRVGHNAVEMLLDRFDPDLSLAVLAAIEADPAVRDVPVLRLVRLPLGQRMLAEVIVDCADLNASECLRARLEDAVATILPQAEALFVLRPSAPAGRDPISPF